LAHKITNKSLINQASYQLNTINLHWSTSTRDLGVVLDNRLTFADHVMSIVQKSNTRAHLILKSFVSRDCNLLMRAFTTYVRPLLEYCMAIWSPHHQYLIDHIESVQRNFTKKIHGLFNKSYTERLSILGLDSLEVRRVKSDLLLCYKIIHGLVDLDPADYFVFATSTTRGHRFKLQKQFSSVDARKYFFCNRVFDVWNDLPDAIVNSASLCVFMEKLNLHNLQLHN
jgi:hypothetical protein